MNFIRKGVGNGTGYDAYLKSRRRRRAKMCQRSLKSEELMRLSREFETIELWLEHIENYDAIFMKSHSRKNG